MKGKTLIIIAIVVVLVLLFVFFFSLGSTVDERRIWLIARRDKLKNLIEKKERLVTKVQKIRTVIFKVTIASAFALMIALFFAAGKIGLVPLTVAGFVDALALYAFLSNTFILMIFNRLISINEICDNLNQRIEYLVYGFIGKEDLVLSLIDNKTELGNVELEIQKLESSINPI